MPKPLRVGIVGAGFAGCSAALNLAQRGVSVTLLEAAPKPGPVGQGIGLQPIGLSALHRMQQPGLLEDVLAHGARVNGIRTWSLRGGEPSVVLDVEYARFDPRMYGLGLGRGVLFSALYERACADAAVDVHVGAAVGDLRERESGVELLQPEGDSLGLYDLVVLADGARSALRAAHGVPSVVRRYDYGALYALLPDPGGVTDHWLSQVDSEHRHAIAIASIAAASSGQSSKSSHGPRRCMRARGPRARWASSPRGARGGRRSTPRWRPSTTRCVSTTRAWRRAGCPWLGLGLGLG